MLYQGFAGLLKPVKQPILGLSLLTLIAIACPPSGLAQTLPGITSSTSSVSPARLEESYTLGAGDRIRIDIFQVPQYSGESEVLVDGSLNLPQVGTVSVQGMTLKQAELAVSTQYASVLRRPIVTVSLLTPRPLQIGIAGEVNRPGSYSVPLQNAQFPTVTQLLETAGGITQSADLRQVQVRRPQMSGSDQVINIDLWQLLQTGDLRYDLTLRDGDTVFIPTATSINLAEAPQLAVASFSPSASQPINIAVVGEVFRPGPYTVTGGTARTAEAGVPGGGGSSGRLPTVTRAIQVAGGIKPLADIRRIQIHRPTRSGTEQVFEVDLWQLLQAGNLSQDAILQEGDTVSVPTATAEVALAEATQVAAASFSPNTIRINVVGEVDRPGSVEVPPNTPLNQVLLAAGGFNNRARTGSVQLVRLNPDGSVIQRRVSIDFAQGINEEGNPPLSNNDVVIVGRSGIASLSDALDTALNPLGRFLTLFSFPARLLNILP